MISMVTCSFERGSLLERTLHSILMQEHKKDWEVIIVDDGSTDNTIDVFHQYKNKMPVRMFRTFRSGYVCQNWPANCGIKQAKGEYIIYASPEVIHRGNTFDTIHMVLERIDALLYGTVYDLTFHDTKWIKRDRSWRKDINILDKFHINKQLTGPLRDNRKGYYWIGGWRKSTFLRIGGMDERFIYGGADDKELIERFNDFDVFPVGLFSMFSPDPVIGYHQYHPRTYLTEEYKNKYLETWDLYVKIREIREKQKAKGIVLPANADSEWGVLPPNSEVL